MLGQAAPYAHESVSEFVLLPALPATACRDDETEQGRDKGPGFAGACRSACAEVNQAVRFCAVQGHRDELAIGHVVGCNAIHNGAVAQCAVVAGKSELQVEHIFTRCTRRGFARGSATQVASDDTACNVAVDINHDRRSLGCYTASNCPTRIGSCETLRQRLAGRRRCRMLRSVWRRQTR